MRPSRWTLLVLVPLAAGALLAACTFPDVGYADADAGSSVPSSSSGAASSGGDPACAQLTACTSKDASCAASAMMADDACLAACKGKPPCTSKCDQTLASARASCAMTCEGCATGCATAASDCRASAGL
jgi:hypothetical protein